MTDHKKQKHEIYALGFCLILLSVLVGCSNEDSGDSARTLKANSSPSTSGVAANTTPPGNLSKPPIVPISGDDSLNNFNEKTNAEAQKAANQALEDEKKRKFEAEEAQKNRDFELTKQNNALTAAGKKELLEATVGLMMIQAQSEMFHPDKCANRNGFIQGIKDTAGALKDAMTTTDAAAAQAKPAAAAPPAQQTLPGITSPATAATTPTPAPAASTPPSSGASSPPASQPATAPTAAEVPSPEAKPAPETSGKPS